MVAVVVPCQGGNGVRVGTDINRLAMEMEVVRRRKGDRKVLTMDGSGEEEEGGSKRESFCLSVCQCVIDAEEPLWCGWGDGRQVGHTREKTLREAVSTNTREAAR